MRPRLTRNTATTRKIEGVRKAVVKSTARTVVPQDSVAVAGEDHRDGDVGIDLGEVDGFAPVVPYPCLVLAETIQGLL